MFAPMRGMRLRWPGDPSPRRRSPQAAVTQRSGQTDAPQGSFSAISAPNAFLRAGDGTITCWGGNSYGQTDAPQGSFSAISAGADSCGLRTDGTITCWGGYRWRDVPGALQRCQRRPTTTAHRRPGARMTFAFPPQLSGLHHRFCGERTDVASHLLEESLDAREAAPEGSFTAVAVGGDQDCGVRTDTI